MKSRKTKKLPIQKLIILLVLVQIFLNAQTLTIAPKDPTVSAGTSATLTASGGTNYVWITGETTPSITVNPTATTTYTVTSSAVNGASAKIN